MRHRGLQLGQQAVQLVQHGRAVLLAERLQAERRRRELGLVVDRRREDHRLRDPQGQPALDADLLDVPLEVDLVAALELAFGEHVVLLEQLRVLIGVHRGDGVDRVAEVRQAALLGFLVPGLGVVVAVEDDRAVLVDDLLEHFLDGGVQLLRVALGLRLQLGGDVVERLGDDRVEDHERAGDGLAGADRAELELVAGEGERAGAVAVARVLRQRRQGVHADRQHAGLLRLLRAALGDLLEDVRELVAEEDGDDRRRSLVGAEAVVVAGVGDGAAQQDRRACARRG